MVEGESFEQNGVGNISFFTFETGRLNDSIDEMFWSSALILWFQASYDMTNRLLNWVALLVRT